MNVDKLKKIYIKKKYKVQRNYKQLRSSILRENTYILTNILNAINIKMDEKSYINKATIYNYISNQIK